MSRNCGRYVLPYNRDTGVYTDEQRDFVLAMGALKARLGRTPTPAEVHREAIRLGYRKQDGLSIQDAVTTLRNACGDRRSH